MLELIEIGLLLFIAFLPLLVLGNFFWAVLNKGAPFFEIPLIKKRCKKCKNPQLSFIQTNHSTSYRHTNKSGKADKRYKNNTIHHYEHVLRCNICNEEFTSPTSSLKMGLMHYLLDRFVFSRKST